MSMPMAKSGELQACQLSEPLEGTPGAPKCTLSVKCRKANYTRSGAKWGRKRSLNGKQGQMMSSSLLSSGEALCSAFYSHLDCY